MLEDKLRHSDWDATYDAIEEAVARESYLSWLKENEKRTRSAGGVKHSASQVLVIILLCGHNDMHVHVHVQMGDSVKARNVA
jgi:hypothetical protein